MSDSETVAMPIGAVTRLTGISSHTLRKWESRYHAIVPIRTDTGRRLYSQDQVNRLIMLRDLIQLGHQISQLSEMDDTELASLSESLPARDIETVSTAGVVVGLVLTAQLANEPRAQNLTLQAVPAAQWLQTAAFDAPTDDTVLVVELPTVQPPVIEQLLLLKREKFARVIVVYGFATQKVLRQLLHGGMVCLKAPIGMTELLQNMAVASEQPGILQILADQPIPEHRFSEESIARLAALSPKLQCECPNHIAQLLLDISAFEQYSMECEDTDPAERALHARLRIIAANARALFEDAMATVAENEGLELEG